MITIYKGYKIRLFPTKEQEKKLWEHIHTCRFIWNYILEQQTNAYMKKDKYLSIYDMKGIITDLRNKDEYTWLTKISRKSMEHVCIDLDQSFQRVFKRKGKWPKYKTKKFRKQSFPVRGDRLTLKNQKVHIEKIGYITYVGNIHTNIKENARISLINNKWILSYAVEYDSQIQKLLTNKSMGIDLGIKELAVVSFGDDKLVFHNINKSQRIKNLEHKLKHIDRVISRKYRTNYAKTGAYEKTKGIIKYENIFREINFKLSNIRKNHTHQTTHKLISLLPQCVIMEGLNVSEMMKNKHLSKSIQQQCFYEFIRQMKYKCEWNGIQFIQVDRFYPSSKMCSCCGNIKKDLKLSDRIYKCNCGLEIDRDYNAAINLMRYVSH